MTPPSACMGILILHLVATSMMIGIIFFVQRVHYPSFLWVGPENFVAFHKFHTQATTGIVVGPMVLELVTAVWLAMVPVPGVSDWLRWLGVFLVIAIWASTFLIQVPIHHTLSGGWNPQLAETLVSTNWIRTLLWAFRGVLVAAMAYGYFYTPRMSVMEPGV